MDKNEMRGNGGNRPSGQTFLILLIAVTLSFFIYSMVRQYFGRVVPTEISYSSFLTMVEKDEISRVEWADNQITVYPKDSASLRESADPGSLPEGWKLL